MLAQIITENGTKKLKPLTADAGAGNPVGTIIPMYKKSSPSGYLYCDGSTFDETQYPLLYAYLGSNVLPDLRELGLKGAEKNTTYIFDSTETDPRTGQAGTQNHDVFTQGEFKDDQVQEHSHTQNTITTGNTLGTNALYFAQSTNQTTGQTGRKGTVTRGKSFGVFYYIKATSGLSENAQDNVVAQLNEERSYSTSEVNTGKKWIDGKNIYKKTVVIDNGGAVLAEDGSYEKSLGVANVDTVISLTGISKAGNQYIVIAGTDATIAGVYTVRPAYDISSGKVIAHIKGYANIIEIIVTVEYTKTTD